MRWMLTVAFRWLPANTEWQFKTVVSRRPPEQWLAERLESAKHGEGKLEGAVLFAREIEEEDAERLERVLES